MAHNLVTASPTAHVTPLAFSLQIFQGRFYAVTTMEKFLHHGSERWYLKTSRNNDRLEGPGHLRGQEASARPQQKAPGRPSQRVS